MYNVLCTTWLHEQGMELLRNHPDIDLRLAPDPSPDELARQVRDAQGIVVRTQKLTRAVLEQAPELKVVSRCGVGVDNVDVAYLSSRNIPLFITTGLNAATVAEHTLMLMLNMARDSRAAQAALERGDWHWREHSTGVELAGRTVLLLGFGHIGQHVAALCRAFSMRVVAWSRSLTESPVSGVELTRDFRAWLPEADFISLHVPLTPETKGILGPEDFARIKPGAFLVNTARGGVVDEDLLLKALEDKVLAGVGLDVFASEPPRADHPLFKHPRSFFTPHHSALTQECMIRISVAAAQNLIDGLEGRFNPEMFYNRKALGL